MTLVECKPPGFDKSKILPLMKERGLDGVLLTSPENVFYTTGFPALPGSGNPILYTLRNRLPYFTFVDGEGNVTLLCWWYAAEGIAFGADDLKVFADMKGAVEALASLLKEKLRTRAALGVETTCPRYVLCLAEDAVGSPAWTDMDDALEELRLLKSEAEIARIRKSTEIIETTVAELFDLIHLGMSRLDLIQEAKARMFKNGATGISHVTFAFGLANPEIAIGEKLETGELVTLDLGAIYDGYASDNRRYAYAGPVPASLQERYQIMVAIVDAVGEALTPGRRYSEVYELARDLYARHGLEPRFNHVGHNIGLETEERWVSDQTDTRVQPGMVINIELYSQAETGEMIGDEETYVVGADGPIRISVLPREIRRIG